MFLSHAVNGFNFFKNMEIDEFPESDQFENWKNWAIPIYKALLTTQNFTLFKDMDEVEADGDLRYEDGQWVIEINNDHLHAIVNSRTKTVEVDRRS